jgi:ketosteroid isomerase-like protein
VTDRLDVVRDVFARYAEGDFRASLPLLDPSIALVVDTDIPDGGNFFGLAGVGEYMTRFLESWETLTIAGEAFDVAGDTVAVKVRQDAVGRGSGATARLDYFHLWTFRGEKAVHIEVTLSEPRVAEALQSQPRWRK